MPYKSEKIKIAHTKFDRRIKLSEEQEKLIKELYAKGLSQRKIAGIVGVDRKTIYNILNPEKYLEQLKSNRENKTWKKYYNKENNSKAIKKTRRYKQNLYVDGKIF